MPRFFVSPEDIKDGCAVLAGDDAKHISRSLRMRCGEPLTLCDGRGNDYFCRTQSFTSDTVTLAVERRAPSAGEPPLDITVYQVLVKGDKFDTVIQKSVECGAARVIPFYSRNCVVKPSDGEDRKRERRARIALEAAMQSGRGRIPEVGHCMDFDCMLSDAAVRGPVLFCYEGEGTRAAPHVLAELGNTLPRGSALSVVIGPEGGFFPEEAENARNAGLIPTGLGPRILRTESAAEFILACIYFEFEA